MSGSGAKQRTVAAEATVEGVGLHTGEETWIRFRPAAVDTGIRFHRVDVDEASEVPVDLEHVSSTERGTSLGSGESRVQTVEHLLAAVMAHQIDNLRIEVHGPEVPIGDGSFAPFYDRLAQAGVEEQDASARVLDLARPIEATVPGGASYAAVPAKTLRISATIEFDHPMIGRQYASFAVDPDGFGRELASARTFGFLHEAEALHARGLALGASAENAIVLDDEGVASGELRFGDEFVRHKIGDIVGDLAVLGRRVRAHIIADRPSHAGNLELARALLDGMRAGAPDASAIDVRRILEHLPHRYPMLLVDRILELEPRERIVGIKNVTINEPFFQGHFPGHPVMPGVLIIEAMAQVGGVLLMDAVEDPDDKVVYFVALDDVKWRRPVTPGDQVRFEVEVLNLRRRVCRMRGTGTVDGRVVAEAEMMAQLVDR
ncbi:MAG: UDP-3-O-acyl-N-acetylglucosamine deacetylase [Gemmatimonadota bacterium]